ncbi:MAG TPA: asparaginase [Blastocatellia bacterium]|jgi:L-asparaginase II|nr:asparaginase [Blastocatellia bacterium]
MNQSGNQTPALVEVTRGSLVESRHRGFIAVVDAAGAVVASLGDIGTPVWFRSAAKPFQAIPIIASGAAARYGFTPRELAVIAGSHSGENAHLETVLSILNKISLDESALKCGAHLPFDEASAKRLRAENKEPRALHNNCSGKHAGMLAFAKHIGEPVENYLDPDHPIQRRIRSTLARFADAPVDEIKIAVDGCSAPVFGLSVEAMARSYARLAGARRAGIEPELAAAADAMVSAMIEYPEMVGGTRDRLDTDLMLVAKGEIISKVGAEGTQLLGVKPNERYPKGLGIAIKIEDGDVRRARDPVVIETLRQLGLLDDAQLAALASYARSTVFNHREIEVGEVRTCFAL